MPNWCQNEIRVSGSEDKVKEFMNFVKSDEQNFDFNSIVPMPKNIFKGALGDKEKEKYGSLNWYDWSCDNWGTKWNACNVSVEYNPEYGDEVEYYFNTAWSPPEQIFIKLRDKFKLDKEDSELFISWFYREDGMEFSGYLQNEV